MTTALTDQLEKVIWGAPSFWIERLPLYCGIEMGFFREQGIDLEIRYTYGGPELATAVSQGEIHIGEMGLPPFVTAFSNGLPAKIIGSSVIQQLDHYVAARLGIDDFADLAGKRIGILSAGSCDDYFIRRMLNAHGIDADTAVDLVPMGRAYGELAAFTDGDVDAAFVVEPRIALAEDRGIATVLGRVGEYFPRYQWGIILASDHWLENRRDRLQRLMAGFRAACRWIQANPDDAAAIGGEVFEVPQAIFKRALDRDLQRWELDARLDQAGLDNALDVQRQMGIAVEHLHLHDMIRQL